MNKKFVAAPYRDTDKGSRAIDQWFHDCERTQVPYLVVREKSRQAQVEWDAISLSQENYEKLAGNAKAVVAFQHALLAKYVARGHARCIITPGVSYFYGVERAAAPQLAAELHDFLAHILETGQPPAGA